MIERTVLINKSDVIEAAALPLRAVISTPAPPIAETPPENERTPPRHAILGLDELCRELVSQLPLAGPAEGEPNVFERLEGSLVMAALERTGGNKQAAANLLGLYRPRLYSIIKRNHPAHDAPKE